MATKISSGTKFYRYRLRYFFPVPSFSNVGSETFSGTNFFGYRLQDFVRYHFFPIPVPISPTKITKKTVPGILCTRTSYSGPPASTFIHIHPILSICIHLHPPASTFIHFCPTASTCVHLGQPAFTCVHLHPSASTCIRMCIVHPLSSTYIHFCPPASTCIHFHPPASTCIHFCPPVSTSIPCTNYIHFCQPASGYLVICSYQRCPLSTFANVKKNSNRWQQFFTFSIFWRIIFSFGTFKQSIAIAIVLKCWQLFTNI